MRMSNLVLSISIILPMIVAGCSDAMTGAPSGEFRTEQQAVSTTHQFSKAPSGSGSVGAWESVGVDIDSNGNVYYAGILEDGSEVSFGCSGSLDNTSDSLDDTFLVKFNSSGTCQWQKSWGDSRNDTGDTRVRYTARDLAITSQDHVVIAYTQYFDEPAPVGSDSATGSRIVELDSSGNVEWAKNLVHDDGYDKVITAIDAGGSSLVATGYHDIDFSFGSSTLPNPTSSEGYEAMILAFDQFSSGSRSENWAKSFGGDGYNIPEDVAVDDSSDDIAVVGNYDDDHEHLNAQSADPATNTSFFIQTVDSAGNHLDAYASPGNPAKADDTEMLTSVAFAPNGAMVIAGEYHEKLNPNCNFLPNSCAGVSAADHSDSDYDYFVAIFGVGSTGNSGAAQIVGTDSWATSSDLNAGSPGSPKIKRERINEVTAVNGIVAISGRAWNPDNEPNFSDGFAHVFDFGGFNSPSAPSRYSYYDETYQNSSHDFYGTSVANTGSTLVVGGTNGETNYSLGGSTLPGGDDFIVRYTF